MKRNGKNIKKRKSIISVIGYPALIGICWLLYLTIDGAFENYKLEKKGIYTWAIIYNKYTVGAKGTMQVDYSFFYKGSKYEGYSYWDREKQIGDSILVFFLESDPDINRSNSLLKISVHPEMHHK